jgi:hypothetical protein
VTEWDWGLSDVDYCPGNLYALFEKCWATNAVEHPQFPVICHLLVYYKAIVFKHPYGLEHVPHDNPQ